MKFTLLFWTLAFLLTSACSKQEDFYNRKPLPVVEQKSDVTTVEASAWAAANEEQVVDEFVQKDGNKEIDIIWVIDNSGSMKDEQEALAKNFNAFIREFISNDVNFRMAVTVTDPSPTWRGYMIRNNPELLTSVALKKNPEAFIEEFRNTVKVGVQGSGNEQGLNAVESFLERYSETFIRKNAYLMVVIVSDEEDSSPKAVSDYVKQLQALKENPGLVKVYSIVDTKNVKDDPTQLLNRGYSRYNDFSKATSGMVVDINQSFHKSLNDIGASVIELLDNFPLKAKPLKDTLRVYVNEELTLEDHYSIVPSSHVLKFSPTAIPAPGAKIRAEYTIKH